MRKTIYESAYCEEKMISEFIVVVDSILLSTHHKVVRCGCLVLTMYHNVYITCTQWLYIIILIKWLLNMFRHTRVCPDLTLHNAFSCL